VQYCKLELLMIKSALFGCCHGAIPMPTMLRNGYMRTYNCSDSSHPTSTIGRFSTVLSRLIEITLLGRGTRPSGYVNYHQLLLYYRHYSTSGRNYYELLLLLHRQFPVVFMNRTQTIRHYRRRRFLFLLVQLKRKNEKTW